MTTLTLLRKDLRVSSRNPLFSLISVLVPLVFVALYSLIVAVSATSPIAVAQHGYGPHSNALVDKLTTMSSVDGRFFEIRTTEPAEAERMFAEGDVGAILEIPAEFDAMISAGVPAPVPLTVFNINSDGTKNFELRVEHALRAIASDGHGGAGLVKVEEDTVFARDMKITTYIGTGLLVFAVLFAAMINTGTLIAREWEDRTAKPLMLSPGGHIPFISGKWLGGLVQTVVSVFLVLAVLALLLDYPVTQLGWASWLALATLFCYGAGFGALLGALLRQSLPLVPIAVVIAVVHFFLSGYESYIRGFAHGGALEAMWQVSSWWPMADLADQMRFEVTGLGEAAVDWPAVAATLLLGALLSTLAVLRLRRQLSFAHGQ